MVIVNIRNIPESLYRKLKARAKKAGLSLPQYMLLEMHKIAEVPTHEEMMKRLAELPPVVANDAPAEINASPPPPEAPRRRRGGRGRRDRTV